MNKDDNKAPAKTEEGKAERKDLTDAELEELTGGVAGFGYSAPVKSKIKVGGVGNWDEA